MISSRCHVPNRVVSALWITLSFAVTAPAQTTDPLDYSAFSLDELFNIDVVTASKQEEPIWEAPGVVSVITAGEIEAFGARNLYEVLERTPSVANMFTLGVNQTSVRGGEHNSASLHILLLINGRPLRTSNGNFSINNTFSTFPLSLIERIEFVRGPGSVLYGTNAFEGVINIITKKDSQGKSTVAVTGGANATKGGELFTTYRSGDLHLSVAGHYLDTDGWSFETPAVDINGTSVPDFRDDVFEDNKGLHITADYKGLNASVWHGKTKQWAETFFNDAYTLSYHWDVTLVDVGYLRELNNRWKLDVHLTHNTEEFVFYRTDRTIDQSFVAIPFDTEDNLLEATLHGKLGRKVNILLGAVYQDLSTDNGTGEFASPFEADSSSVSAYTQLDYRPNRFVKLIAGAQYNKPEETDSDIVPRLSGIFNLSPNAGLKALYGEAFRAPTPFERLVNNAMVQVGDPNLETETATTFDLQMFYRIRSKTELSWTYFHTEEERLIRLVPKPDLIVGAYENATELTLEGVETEIKYAPTASWLIVGSASYQESEDEENNTDATFAPNTTAKLGIAYTHRLGSVGLFNVYTSEYHTEDDTSPPPLGVINPGSRSALISSLNTELSLSQLFESPLDYSFRIYISNLFDEEKWVPDSITSIFNTIPGYGERAYYATFELTY